ncbi:recombination mediator RecR [Dasania sp. GY-MA-18]|uniref:Recombination protein RecR n=1 Tax=Dasania phycosphaerae TaxID=2950436 RepID=A0A9J6RJL2_9GAMM|nr:MULTISPECIES: recombination mediator RecR [Dasania]MCR8921737.1 recombination mediator RecR [Dasania sp. GY-MA-18]MCZ0864165.1 recombination mediator RecR [Dasania phycosphaerae]MCZ0867893.1 recombination mediator RecR [Dasania phycosphaerae]
MAYSPLIDQLVDALRCLPGVGPKSAQRMAFHLLERDREGGFKLAQHLEQAMQGVNRCEQCRTLTEQPKCAICANTKRDHETICVVEAPSDVVALEQSGQYRGTYFVLMGKLSPIDGIGPEEIGVSHLLTRIQQQQVKEVILATNPTVEGEATAYYITAQLKALGVTVSRIAHGVPLGGELEFVDVGTLAHALEGRQVIA